MKSLSEMFGWNKIERTQHLTPQLYEHVCLRTTFFFTKDSRAWFLTMKPLKRNKKDWRQEQMILGISLQERHQLSITFNLYCHKYYISLPHSPCSGVAVFLQFPLINNNYASNCFHSWTCSCAGIFLGNIVNFLLSKCATL